MSVVLIRGSPYYGGFLKRKCLIILSGHLETVRNREVSLPGGSTTVQVSAKCKT